MVERAALEDAHERGQGGVGAVVHLEEEELGKLDQAHVVLLPGLVGGNSATPHVLELLIHQCSDLFRPYLYFLLFLALGYCQEITDSLLLRQLHHIRRHMLPLKQRKEPIRLGVLELDEKA